jgi:nicotinamide-nucleotide amidase
VAYDTSIKNSLLGVDQALLDEHGPVHPLVAEQMARNVRDRFAIDGKPADIGLSTTGVAGPDPQQGQEAGLVYVGIAIGDRVESIELHLDGTRDQIRAKVVSEAVAALANRLE